MATATTKSERYEIGTIVHYTNDRGGVYEGRVVAREDVDGRDLLRRAPGVHYIVKCLEDGYTADVHESAIVPRLANAGVGN